ncbi:hypothetical protein EDC04DRAFT_2699174 [Pisolithus marmoratus]|nr:hypothetical protein EDC04DRAFT_2699174 [Pisolithus marmoratus]
MTNRFARNIALVGEGEVVKSFVSVVSRTRPILKTRTSGATCYVVDMGSDAQVTLWETISWKAGAAPKRTALDTRVLQYLRSSCGIDLILFCIKARMGSSEDFVPCYDEVYVKECQRKAPVALIATGLEWSGGNMHGWWEKNKDNMFHLGLAFDVHACITTLHSHDDPCIQEQINISQTRVEALLQIQDYSQQLSHNPICSNESLEHSGGIPCSPEGSSVICAGSLQARTVAIVGASGVGKSSVINAIAGEKRARISSDADVCTRECKVFLVELKPGIITEVWDTVGWGEPCNETVTGLVKRLIGTRGIDLLLLCVHAGDRVKGHIERFKRDIQPECRKKVPVILVVTGLEKEDDMDMWWTNNKNASVFHELLVDGHACVTTVAKSDDLVYQQRIQRSLLRLRELVHRPIPSSVSFYELTREDAVIFLLGCTGCGKSQFISTLTGIPEDEAGVGHALQSRTYRFTAFKFPDSFNSGTPVVLIDTPGFNNSDSTLSDEVICKSMSVWLHEMYKRDIIVAGILYLHRPTDHPAMAHIRPFVEVYGESVYCRVCLVATMQDDAVDHQNESKISQRGDLDQLVSKGAKEFVYENTPESSRELCQKVTNDIDVARAAHLKRVVSELCQELPNSAGDRNADDVDLKSLEGLANKHLELIKRIREQSANEKAPEECLEQSKSVRRQMEDVLAQNGQGMSPPVERIKRCLRTY